MGSAHDADTSGGNPMGNTGGAGSDGTEASAPEVHLGPGSWDVRGDVTTLDTPAITCGHFDFTLTVDDGGTLTLSRDGDMDSAAVQIVDGAYVEAARISPATRST